MTVLDLLAEGDTEKNGETHPTAHLKVPPALLSTEPSMRCHNKLRTVHMHASAMTSQKMQANKMYCGFYAFRIFCQHVIQWEENCRLSICEL